MRPYLPDKQIQLFETFMLVPENAAMELELFVHSKSREPPVNGSFSMPQVKLPPLDAVEPGFNRGTSMIAMLSPVESMYSSVVPSELLTWSSAVNPLVVGLKLT